MTRHRVTATALAVAALGAATGPARGVGSSDAPHQRYLVSFTAHAPGAAYEEGARVAFAALRRVAGRSQRAFRAQAAPLVRRGELRIVRGFWISNAVEISATTHAVRTIRRLRGVAHVAKDSAPRRPGGRGAERLPAPRGRRAGPAGPLRLSHAGETPQPNITLIGAPTLWAAGADGIGMKVGVIDTDIDATHPVFGCTSGQTWTQTGTKCGRVIAYGDFSSASPFSVEPGHWTYTNAGHGTWVTSVLAGGADPATGKVWGVAPGASILFAANTDSGGAITVSANLAAGQWLADPDGNSATTSDRPAAVNGSWTTSSFPTTLTHDMVRAFRAAGIVPVFGIGNYGPSPGSVATPGAFPDALGVGNTDNSDLIRADSSRGCAIPIVPLAGYCPDKITWDRAYSGSTDSGPPPGLVRKPDLTAPGYSIPVACYRPLDPCSDFGGIYAGNIVSPGGSGTSFASPHVAGAALLLKERHPGWTPGQIMQALRASALDLGTVGWDPDYGWGRIRVDQADGAGIDTNAPGLSKVSPADGGWVVGQIDVSFTVSPGERLDDVVLGGGGAGSKPLSYDEATGALVVRYAGLGTGARTLTAQVVNEAGNASAVAQHTANSDVSYPNGSISATAATGASSMTFSGTASDAGSGVEVVTIRDTDSNQLIELVPAGGAWTYTKSLNPASPASYCAELVSVRDKVGLVTSGPDLNGGASRSTCGSYAPPPPQVELIESSGGGASTVGLVRMRVTNVGSYLLTGTNLSAPPTRTLGDGTVEWDVALPLAGSYNSFTARAYAWNGQEVQRSVQIWRDAGTSAAPPPPAPPASPPPPSTRTGTLLRAAFSKAGRLTLIVRVSRPGYLGVRALGTRFSKRVRMGAGVRCAVIVLPKSVLRARRVLVVSLAGTALGRVRPPRTR